MPQLLHDACVGPTALTKHWQMQKFQLFLFQLSLCVKRFARNFQFLGREFRVRDNGDKYQPQTHQWAGGTPVCRKGWLKCQMCARVRVYVVTNSGACIAKETEWRNLQTLEPFIELCVSKPKRNGKKINHSISGVVNIIWNSKHDCECYSKLMLSHSICGNKSIFCSCTEPLIHLCTHSKNHRVSLFDTPEHMGFWLFSFASTHPLKTRFSASTTSLWIPTCVSQNLQLFLKLYLHELCPTFHFITPAGGESLISPRKWNSQRQAIVLPGTSCSEKYKA